MTEDEQAFWDAAYCAALTGLLAMYAHPQSRGLESPEELVRDASRLTDLSLSTRRLRTEKDKP